MHDLPRFILTVTATMLCFAATEISLGETQRSSDPLLLTLDRIFADGEFKERGLGQFKWSQRTASYFTLEAPQAAGSGRDLVRYDIASGAKEIVVLAEAFIPQGATEPLKIEAFTFSADESRLLIYTQSKRVWRLNTRGDYWVLDIGVANSLRKLGGDVEPSTLMFAKFSPDGTRVAYVRSNNIYVQALSDLTITALTADGSPSIINGTADWVNEKSYKSAMPFVGILMVAPFCSGSSTQAVSNTFNSSITPTRTILRSHHSLIPKSAKPIPRLASAL